MKRLDADAATVLRRCGVRPSVQRVAVMDYLLKHRTHPTAEEVSGWVSAAASGSASTSASAE